MKLDKSQKDKSLADVFGGVESVSDYLDYLRRKSRKTWRIMQKALTAI